MQKWGGDAGKNVSWCKCLWGKINNGIESWHFCGKFEIYVLKLRDEQPQYNRGGTAVSQCELNWKPWNGSGPERLSRLADIFTSSAKLSNLLRIQILISEIDCEVIPFAKCQILTFQNICKTLRLHTSGKNVKKTL